MSVARASGVDWFDERHPQVFSAVPRDISDNCPQPSNVTYTPPVRTSVLRLKILSTQSAGFDVLTTLL